VVAVEDQHLLALEHIPTLVLQVEPLAALQFRTPRKLDLF